MSKTTKTPTRSRSSITGRFVTDAFRKSHPNTTEKEVVKKTKNK
jgi:hypothetical protein